EDYGLPELAARLRRVTAARDVGEALPAIALASSACRLLRARLPADAQPEGEWRPLLPSAPARRLAWDQVLPLARVPIDGSEAWVCQRARGGVASDLMLIDPLALDSSPPADTATTESDAGRAEPRVSWLRRAMGG